MPIWLTLTVDDEVRDYEARIVVTGEEAELLLVRDITESRQNQEKLREASRLASVGELAAGVAHEINNPLTGIVGFSEFMMNVEPLPDAARTDLERIHSEARPSGPQRSCKTLCRLPADTSRR